MDVTVNVDASGLEEAFRQLPERVQKTVLRKALLAAARRTKRALRDLTPERTDNIGADSAKSNSLPPGTLKRDARAGAWVDGEDAGSSVGFSPDTAHVARWINDGFNWTTHTAQGHRQIKGVVGYHFIEAAFDESATAAFDDFMDALREGIPEAE